MARTLPSEVFSSGLCVPAGVRSNGELAVPHAQARPVDSRANVRPYDRHTSCESGNSTEEVPEQDGNAVRLNYEADEGPP